jgi:hypothetical protein
MNQFQTSSDVKLSRDPSKAMQEMMDIINSLKGIYISETNALNNADTKGFLALQPDKIDAAQKYQLGIEHLMARKDEMKSANPNLKKRLADMQEEFSDLATKNMEALQRMERTTHKLVDTIVFAAKEAAQKQRIFSYGETGAVRGGEKKSLYTGRLSETA